MLNIGILAIGNEILCGKVVNTNSAFIAREVEKIGGKIVYQQVVADDEEAIVKGLKEAYSSVDLVLTIGGLGSTVDDVTRYGVAKYFNEPFIYNQQIAQEIQDYFTRSNELMPRNNERQAYGFTNGVVIPNPNGTAPGLYLEKNKQAVFLLPGPLNELEPLVTDHVITYIKERVDEPRVSKSYRLYGIGESLAEEKIMALYKKYPMLQIAPYCTVSYIDYVVWTVEKFKRKLGEFEEEFLLLLNEHLGGDQETSLNEVIIDLLKEKGLTLSTVESCTGGLLAAELVKVAGASTVFKEGMITYCNGAKIKRLGIDPEILAEHGAVSELVARQMSQCLKSQTETDITIAITGIAGPHGGTPLKPVGLTYIGITVGDQTFVESYLFNGNREKIRVRAMTQALFLLYRRIKTF